jgi:hypothetical protein
LKVIFFWYDWLKLRLFYASEVLSAELLIFL